MRRRVVTAAAIAYAVLTYLARRDDRVREAVAVLERRS